MRLSFRSKAVLSVVVLVGMFSPVLASTQEGNCPKVELALHLTNQLLKVTGGWLEECGFQKADSVFHRALSLQRKALLFFRKEYCRTAFQYTQASRRHAFEAVVLCFSYEGLCQRTKGVLLRTNKAIDFLDSLIRECDNPEAKHLFITGVEFQKNAIQALKENHCPPALELTLLSRRFILKAAHICHEDGGLLASFPELDQAKDLNPSGIDQPAIAGLLQQNSPNPFNAQTTISYSLPSDSKVKLTVYNIRGQRVKTLVDEFQSAGQKFVIWDGTNESSDRVASGVYFYRLEASHLTETKRMVFLK